jgi:hypothetical protein
MSHYLVTEDTTELPFWKNRKFVTPVLAALATLAVAILSQTVELPFTDQKLGELLAAIWFFVVGIISGGDVAYDLLGQILRIITEIVNANQPLTAAQHIRPSEMVAPDADTLTAYRPNTSAVYDTHGFAERDTPAVG